MHGKHKTVLTFEFCKPKSGNQKVTSTKTSSLIVQSNFTRKHHGANKKWWCGQTFCFNLYQNMQSFNACDWISSHATSVFVEGLYDQFDFHYHLLSHYNTCTWRAMSRARLMFGMLQRGFGFFVRTWSRAWFFKKARGSAKCENFARFLVWRAARASIFDNVKFKNISQQ